MFQLYANKTQMTVPQREVVASGAVNAYPVRFEFSPDWDGLTKTAIFRAGVESRAVLLDESGACVIPWEPLETPGVHLFAGVYGTRDGHTVLPTIWADLGVVLEGASPDRPSLPPTPELWEQQLAAKGDRLDCVAEGVLGLYAGDRLLSSVAVSGGSDWGIGHGLKIVGGELTVDTTDDFQGDNTLPMTAAGVQATVGNIQALLGTI